MKRIITTLSIIAIFGQGCTRCYVCKDTVCNTETKICRGDSYYDAVRNGGYTNCNGAEIDCVPQ